MESGRDKKKKTSERNSIVKGTLHCEPKKKMRYSEAGTPRKTTEIFEREKIKNGPRGKSRFGGNEPNVGRFRHAT